MMQTIQLAGIAKPQQLTSPIYKGSHFTWGEATKSGTRVPVDCTIDGDEIAAETIVANIILVAKELDIIRHDLGDNPITIISWYRDPNSNRAAGGVRNSQHQRGWAVDFTVYPYRPRQVAARLTRDWPGGLGDSVAYTHIDMRHRLGLAAARWD
jgi:zinc D-Ala-D-Ala carboxypeptidase